MLDRLITWPEEITRTSLKLVGYRARSVHTAFGDLSLLESNGGGRFPLMMLHGFSSEGVHYAPLLRFLRPQVSRVYLPDLPAHGKSAAPSAPVVAGELRAEIVQAFDQIIEAPTVLYGNSLGGLVALYYAIARPEKVKGLILCSPGGAAMSDLELGDLRRIFQLRSYREALAFVDRLFVERSALRLLIAWGVRRKFASPDLQALLTALKPVDLLRPEELATLKVPTLLTWGTEDRILPRSSLEFFRRHLPAATTMIEEPSRQSHTPYLEHPDAVARRIVDFIQNLPS
jgi:pimeloyl-ACP methyl ester carboxylesterase